MFHQLQAELSCARERIQVLEQELGEVEDTFSREKREIEDVLEKAGLDKSDLTSSVKDLHNLLQSALGRLYPDSDLSKDDGQRSDLLETYVKKLANTH